ncbi:sigma-70 factor [Oceanococcus atlanticus]|uniref:Sigma-70 factor n=1 Tax=Oceanococcus atlanticus TaxID=1317117 RepID=A0A1Y1SHZ7_9GAMM|nr:biopolymer transporter ExbD [Oceanococcus atlanticus]ORE89302.1 sigma-70 factor [Oceanococcus atlanticus]RZO85043.1 MAG: biopolymer transporter ExbD [Oceanococcus sp.]
MNQTRRAHRMEVRAMNKNRVGSLNLVSLMDIFTILVFFLLAQSAAVEVLPNAENLELPESLATERARETVLVMITEKDILVNGQAVMPTAEASRSSGDLSALRTALEAQAERVVKVGDSDEQDRGEITIMADKGLPYALIKKVMLTCTQAQYGLLSFAVLQRDQDTVNLGGTSE